MDRAKNKLAVSRPVQTIKKEKYRFHYFIAFSKEVTCIVTIIMLENMFWNINSAVFTYEGIENSAVKFACLQMLNISLRKIFIYLFALFKVETTLALTNKNHPANKSKKLHTYIE